MQLKKNLVHIICGLLTLAMVVSTYLFYDKTAGNMRRISYNLENTSIPSSQIDDTYRLIKQIDLNNYSKNDTLMEETIFLLNNEQVGSNDIVLSIEDVNQSLMFTVLSDLEFDEKKRISSAESFFIDLTDPSSKYFAENVYVKFKIKDNLNYKIQMTHFNQDESQQANQFEGVVKIYARIGGDTNE